MRILLDHCVPKPFGRLLIAHDVKTAGQMGWARLQNGKLLAAAATAFEVFLTVDKNIRHQQNLGALPISVIMLDAVANTPEALAPFAPFVEQALALIKAGQLLFIDRMGNISEIS